MVESHFKVFLLGKSQERKFAAFDNNFGLLEELEVQEFEGNFQRMKNILK